MQQFNSSWLKPFFIFKYIFKNLPNRWADGLSCDSEILWATEEFMVDSVTAGSPAPCRSGHQLWLMSRPSAARCRAWKLIKGVCGGMLVCFVSKHDSVQCGQTNISTLISSDKKSQKSCTDFRSDLCWSALFRMKWLSPSSLFKEVIPAQLFSDIPVMKTSNMLTEACRVSDGSVGRFCHSYEQCMLFEFEGTFWRHYFPSVHPSIICRIVSR